METCKYCGHAGEHAPECPTQPKKERKGIDDRESAVPGFSVKEVHEITGVVDWGKRIDQELLDRVTTDNIDAMIAAEERRMIDHRNRINAEEITGMNAEDIVDKMYMRNSSSHAFQCSINKAEDFGTYFDHVQRIGGERGADERNPDLVVLSEFLRRQETMNDLMTKLLEKDIARRLGGLKGDPAFFEKAMADFPTLADELLDSLDGLEKANAAKVARNEDVRQQLENLRGRLAAAKDASPGTLDANFYGDVCMAYSILIFEDAEVLNEGEVRDAAARLEGRERSAEEKGD